MSVSCFSDLLAHYGHNVQVNYYGDLPSPANVAIECMDCHEVLLDYDTPDADDPANQLVLSRYLLEFSDRDDVVVSAPDMETAESLGMRLGDVILVADYEDEDEEEDEE